MKIFATVPGTGLLLAGTAPAQTQVVPGKPTAQVPEHLWTIMGWSNIGIAIVVRRNTTPVVDAGLGPRHRGEERLPRRHHSDSRQKPDKTLISRDPVRNKVVRNIYGAGGRPASWIAVADRVAGLGVLPVLPDHSARGDGSPIGRETPFITDLRMRTLDLRRKGDEPLTAEFKTKYPGGPTISMAGFVKRVHAE